MNKFIFNDYFHVPQGKIAKRMLFKSDNVIAFVLNIAKGEILPGHTHMGINPSPTGLGGGCESCNGWK